MTEFPSGKIGDISKPWIKRMDLTKKFVLNKKRGSYCTGQPGVPAALNLWGCIGVEVSTAMNVEKKVANIEVHTIS
jgi:hypothetical protein